MTADDASRLVVDGALRVHRTLGPGLLESTYERCLAAELEHRGLCFQRQVLLPVRYRGLVIDSGYRVDFLVEDSLIVELKAIAAFDRVHVAQVLTYLKLSGCTAGLLINFNVALLRDGIRRLVLDHPRS